MLETVEAVVLSASEREVLVAWHNGPGEDHPASEHALAELLYPESGRLCGQRRHLDEAHLEALARLAEVGCVEYRPFGDFAVWRLTEAGVDLLRRLA